MNSADPAVQPKTFAVIGAGPVGSIVAAHLAHKGYKVVLCDIAEHLLAPAQDPGIIIEGAIELQQKIEHVCNDVEQLAEYSPDAVFVTVKANSLPLLSSSLEIFQDQNASIVSWQNGIDTEMVIAETLGREKVMRAVVNWGCGLAAPGRVHVGFHHPPHFVQEMDPNFQQPAQAVASALTASGLETIHTDQIVSMVWRKSIMNASMNPVCATTGMTMAEAMNDPIVYQTINSLVKESIRVARANEIFLGWDYYSYCMGYLKNAGHHKPSMLMDIEAKRRTEIDFMNGKIAEYGERCDISTPFNSTLRALVKGLESKL
ncbi:MAG: 2-dehydropantoate 2-reductase [Desulfovermiculus sp.]